MEIDDFSKEITTLNKASIRIELYTRLFCEYFNISIFKTFTDTSTSVKDRQLKSISNELISFFNSKIKDKDRISTFSENFKLFISLRNSITHFNFLEATSEIPYVKEKIRDNSTGNPLELHQLPLSYYNSISLSDQFKIFKNYHGDKLLIELANKVLNELHDISQEIEKESFIILDRKLLTIVEKHEHICASLIAKEGDIRLLCKVNEINLFEEHNGKISAVKLERLIHKLSQKKIIKPLLLDKCKKIQHLRNKLVHCNFIEFNDLAKKYFNKKYDFGNFRKKTGGNDFLYFSKIKEYSIEEQHKFKIGELLFFTYHSGPFSDYLSLYKEFCLKLNQLNLYYEIKNTKLKNCFKIMSYFVKFLNKRSIIKKIS